MRSLNSNVFPLFYFCFSTGPATVECYATKVKINRKWDEHAIPFDAVSLFRSFVISELNFCELNEDTCQNDGKCTSVTEDEGAFKCECPSGYRGKNCEIAPPQMYPSANVTSAAVRPSKVPVIITSLKPQNATETSSSTVKDGEPDDEIDNEAKWAGRLVQICRRGYAPQMTTILIYLFIHLLVVFRTWTQRNYGRKSW